MRVAVHQILFELNETEQNGNGKKLTKANLLRPSNSWNKYALQMAIKLKVSKIVNTEFYVTLDADVLVANNLVVSDFVDNDRRGNYVQEARSVHPRWWEVSPFCDTF